MSNWQPGFVASLRELCGETAVRTDSASLMSYENDGLGFHRYRPDCVVIPRDGDELKDVVRRCRNEDFPYTIRAAGTSLSGGPVAVQGGLIIHVSRLRSILEINTEDMYCVVEPGVVLDTLNSALEPHGVFYPPDPSSGSACTIGGNVAENAGGIRCFRYGVTANYVLGLEVILPDGEIAQLGGPAGGLGPSCGCDWKSLFVGSEGLLGVITKIWLKVMPLPQKVWTFLGAYPGVRPAADTIVDLVHHPSVPVAIELMDSYVVQLVEAGPHAQGFDPSSWLLLAEVDGPAELVDRMAEDLEEVFLRNGALSFEKTCEPDARVDLWRARKTTGGLLGQLSPDNMVQDACIPRSEFGDLMEALIEECERQNQVVVSVFHAGDGNLHPNFLFDGSKPEELERINRMSEFLMHMVVERGGTLSGEHGIGNDKMKYISLVFGDREIAFQRALMDVFNPDNQLNPEKLFPQRSFVGCCAPPAS